MNEQLGDRQSLMVNGQLMVNREDNEKSAQRRSKHCTLAVVRRSQKFCPAADPFPGAWAVFES